jgi:hypothetical protein
MVSDKRIFFFSHAECISRFPSRIAFFFTRCLERLTCDNGSARWTSGSYELALAGKLYACDKQDSSTNDGPGYVIYFSPSLDIGHSFQDMIHSTGGYDYGAPLDFDGYFVVRQIVGYCESEFLIDDLVVNEDTRQAFSISPANLDDLVSLRHVESTDPQRIFERTQMMQLVRVEDDSIVLRKWSFKDPEYSYELTSMSSQPVSMFAPISEFERVAVPDAEVRIPISRLYAR